MFSLLVQAAVLCDERRPYALNEFKNLLIRMLYACLGCGSASPGAVNFSGSACCTPHRAADGSCIAVLFQRSFKG